MLTTTPLDNYTRHYIQGQPSKERDSNTNEICHFWLGNTTTSSMKNISPTVFLECADNEGHQEA